MVADARMFHGSSHPRHTRLACVSGSLLAQLADGSLGVAVLKMAEDLATLGAAIDLALAEDEIDRLDDAAIDALLSEMGLIAEQCAEPLAESFDELFEETDEESLP